MDALKDPQNIFRFTGNEYLTVNIGPNNTREYLKVPYLLNFEGHTYVRQGWTKSTGDVHFILAKLVA